MVLLLTVPGYIIMVWKLFDHFYVMKALCLYYINLFVPSLATKWVQKIQNLTNLAWTFNSSYYCKRAAVLNCLTSKSIITTHLPTITLIPMLHTYHHPRRGRNGQTKGGNQPRPHDYQYSCVLVWTLTDALINSNFHAYIFTLRIERIAYVLSIHKEYWLLLIQCTTKD